MAKIKTNPLLNLPSMGGKACLKKHGKSFYKKIADERWAKYRENKNKLEKK